MLYKILDSISYKILNIKVWWIYAWCVFMTSLSLIVLFSGQYTMELYYATLMNIGTPIGFYIAVQYYKARYFKQV